MSKTYNKDTDVIKAKEGETFSVELEGNATTGYQWTATVDSDVVEFVDKKTVPSSELVGAGGKEVLTFKVLSEGKATIRLDYKRSWENESAETVKIKVAAKED